MRNQTENAAPVKRRRNDILLLAGVLVAVTIFALAYFLTRQEGAYAAVIQQGTEIARYSLAEDRQVPIQTGGEVTNLLVIREGKAQITEADCPDQICVHHRPVSKAGETIVCLPRELVIQIVGEKSANEPDVAV